MNGYLCLESGECYQGRWHGGVDRAGEVVFNTSHSGYEEIATDPSYHTQIVVLTAPMQGNYGVDNSFWESKKLWIHGFVCLSLQESERDQAWKTRLLENKIPILTEFDTRTLVMRLRQSGTPWGALVGAENAEDAQKKAKVLIAETKKADKDWVYFASCKEVETRVGKKANGPRIAVLDFGSKENILRELAEMASELRIFPSRTSADQIRAYNPDGIMLTNGPGDPADVQVAPQTVRELLGWKPVFGICMGHQILGLALGGKTFKLKFGHRGSNHPIKDDLLKRIYMTSQNHGYAVDQATLPGDVKVTHTNLNDNTVAGFYSAERKCLGIQFHPESHPGPHEARDLFRFFFEEL
jgi:carbamoyl-phosphate synthase small subunit